MELPYKGMKLHLGLFNLENHHWRGGWKNGITNGLVTRSICSLPGQDDDVANRIADSKLRMEQHVNSEASMQIGLSKKGKEVVEPSIVGERREEEGIALGKKIFEINGRNSGAGCCGNSKEKSSGSEAEDYDKDNFSVPESDEEQEIEVVRDEIFKGVVGLFQIENMAPSQAATEQVCLSMNLLCHFNSEIAVGNQISKSSQRGRKKCGKERAIIIYNPNSNPNISNPEIRVSKDHIEVFGGMERSAAILEKDDKAAEENQIFAKPINCFSY
ncbi:hypothetical protein TIFTF001_017389 [Ficus carica]|uniref:Uncharacterized protein n=1 Tax=Ficus carica TaxID=3494 RepID=A0AA88D9M7_FICCA|nr:hypothetical protein TIFTF001_017389 [Ficus carica]